MRVIYVDDESPALDNFRLTVEGLPEIDTLELFRKSEEALKWAEGNPVDVTFLDIEMPVINGIELARRLKQIDRNIRIFFTTAYEQYALDAFGVNALGYILKPYSREEVKEALETAALVRPRPAKEVIIQTIPGFAVWVNGNRLPLSGGKKAELLALLVDHAEAGVTSGEAIACLWPGRPADEKTQTLYRVTFHRLMDELKEAGIDYIIGSEGKKKYLVTDQVECDLYHILDGKAENIKNYGGDYMKDYSWSETRNAQLLSIKEAMTGRK